MASTINASTTLGLISSADTSGVLQLQTANTAAVTIDASQNVGVGTASPSNKLDVAGTARTSNTTGNKVFYLGQSTPSGNDGASLEFQNSSSQTNWAIRSNYNVGGGLEFCPSSAAGGTSYTTPSMVISSSGNLGLGVTPSAWRNDYKVIDVNTTSSFYGRSSFTEVGVASNFFRNSAGSYIYKTSGYAAWYVATEGQHQWFTAPSGTAGNAISFSQAMTLDASGGLLLGTTTSASRSITIGGIAASIALAGSNAGIYFGAGGTVTGNGGFGVNAAIARAGDANYHITGSAAGDLCIAPEGTKAILFGTSSSASSVTERARITSGGRFYVNTTTAPSVDDASIGVVSPANLPAISAIGASGAWAIKVGTVDTTSARYMIGFCNNSGATLGGITTNGTVITYGGTSDYRLKEISGNLSGYKERLLSLKPKQGTWKTDGAEFRGFLAHEFAEQYPASVVGEKDAVDAEGNAKHQSMQAGTAEVIADIIALVQEQQAIIQQLQADVAALKG